MTADLIDHCNSNWRWNFDSTLRVYRQLRRQIRKNHISPDGSLSCLCFWHAIDCPCTSIRKIVEDPCAPDEYKRMACELYARMVLAWGNANYPKGGR